MEIKENQVANQASNLTTEKTQFLAENPYSIPLKQTLAENGPPESIEINSDQMSSNLLNTIEYKSRQHNQSPEKEQLTIRGREEKENSSQQSNQYNKTYLKSHVIKNKDSTIREQFDEIVRNDFKRFIQHRKCLNLSNLYLIYIFHFVQSLGIFTTTLSVTVLKNELIWVGIFLNCTASLIYIYEQLNNKISYKLQQDIIAIMENRYICEGQLIDPQIDIEMQQKVRK